MIPDDRGRMAQLLFEFLERDGLAYCVLGDTRGIPAAIRSDVDIAVAHDCLAEVPETLARFGREHGAHMVQSIRHERTARYFILAWAGATGAPRLLAVDFCSHYLRNGRRLLGADDLLEGRELTAGDSTGARPFYVPAAPVRFIYYLVKKIDKGELSDEHGEYLSKQWHSDPARARAWVQRFWNQPDDADLIARAAAAGNWPAVRPALPRLRRALRCAAPLSARGLLGELGRAVERIVRPTGAVFAVLGPDGSGKSTVIERALAMLAPAFRGTAHLHLRPRVVSGGGASARAAVDDPHGLPPRGRLASAAKLAALVCDYVVGHWLRTWPLTIRSTAVVYDRYYHDLLVDPLRFRYGGSAVLARLAARLVPAPDLFVLLDAPPVLLQARKAEVPVEESARQREGYRDLFRRFHNATVIDASRPAAEVAADVAFAILSLLAERLERRHPELREYENPLSARLLLFFCRYKVPVLSKLFRIAFNSDIYCRMRSPILIPHPYGIIIHSRAVLGSHVTVMQQVTIGSKDRGENVAPTIEDDVYVGAGAKLLGGIRVGKGAVIGANAVVTRDVPAYCTVVGVNRLVRGGEPYDLVGYAPPAGARAASREPLNAA